MTNISKHPILKQCYELMRNIEQFPASEQETKTIIKAGELMDELNALVDEQSK
jgi:hypothetical protein